MKRFVAQASTSDILSADFQFCAAYRIIKTAFSNIFFFFTLCRVLDFFPLKKKLILCLKISKILKFSSKSLYYIKANSNIIYQKFICTLKIQEQILFGDETLHRVKNANGLLILDINHLWSLSICCIKISVFLYAIIFSSRFKRYYVINLWSSSALKTSGALL